MTERTDILLSETRGHLRILTINRPDRMNSLSPEMSAALVEAFVEAGSDPDIRCIILTAVGERAFCAGADLKAAPHYTAADWAEIGVLADRVFATLALLPVPTVAAINGHAIGGGLVLALACDLRLGTTAPARFGLPEVARDIAFPKVALALVQENLTAAVLRDLALSARLVGNAEAVQLGLIDRTVPGPELLTRARDLAAERAALRGYATVKAQVLQGLRARIRGKTP